MSSRDAGSSEKLGTTLACVGEVAPTAAAAIIATAVLGPVGPLVAVPVEKAVSAAPPEAKVAGGVGSALGAGAAVKTLVMVGGVGLAPAAATVALAAGVVGGVALGVTWLAKKWFR